MLKKDDMKQWIILILIAVASYWTATNLDTIFTIISKIIKVLSPFLIGLAIAFILNIPMTKIENTLNKLIKNKNFPTRIISIIISLILFIFVIAFILLLLVPEVIESIEKLIAITPGIVNDLEIWLLNLLEKYPQIQKEISNIFSNNNLDTMIPNLLNYIINSSVTLITKLVTSIITTFTAVVFSIYILSQKEEVISGTKKLIKTYLPKETSDRIIEIGSLTNQTFTKFISGQCVDAVFLGIIMFIAFTIFRFPYALLIAVLTTITALIPIFGALIAMVIGAILIATESPIQALIFVVVFQVIQQIEGNFIYPRVVGKSVGLSPMWTLVAITIGGSLFGILGMLTFLPLASVGYAIFKDDIIKRTKKVKDI